MPDGQLQTLLKPGLWQKSPQLGWIRYRSIASASAHTTVNHSLKTSRNLCRIHVDAKTGQMGLAFQSDLNTKAIVVQDRKMKRSVKGSIYLLRIACRFSPDKSQCHNLADSC